MSSGSIACFPEAQLLRNIPPTRKATVCTCGRRCSARLRPVGPRRGLAQRCPAASFSETGNADFYVNSPGFSRPSQKMFLSTVPNKYAHRIQSNSCHLVTLYLLEHWRGAWVAQSVKRPTSAQVMSSPFVSSSHASGSVLTAQSWEPASNSLSSSFSAPPPLMLCLLLAKINFRSLKKKKLCHSYYYS